MQNKAKNNYVFLVIDTMCLLISFVLSFYIRHNNLDIFNNDIYKKIVFFSILIEILYSLLLKRYKDVFERGYLVELKNTIEYAIAFLLSTILYFFVTKQSSNFSRIVLFLTYIIYVLFAYVMKIILKKVLVKKFRQKSLNGNKSVLVVCKEKEVEEVIRTIVKYNYNFISICGICVIDKKNSSLLNKAGDYKIVANRETIVNYVSTNWVDEIFVATENKNIPVDILNQLAITGIPINFKINKIDGLDGRKQIVSEFGPYSTIRVVRRTYSPLEIIIKRLIDIIGGLFGTLFAIVIFVFLAPIIYIKSPGPIIYVSNRVGKNGKIFKFYKFRSMVLNADELKKDLSNNNRIKDGMMFKLDNDPRIIPGIGHFIRETSLDEFPQFFNVLKGDMSLVGTRPPTLDEWNKYSPYYRSRLSIKPGITGMWQVSGRSDITDFNEVVRLDNEYISNWSLSLDIKILLKTISVVFRHDGSM